MEIINQQKIIKIEITNFRIFAKKAAESVFETFGKDFSVAFISDEKMRELNLQFRGKDKTTDVLSFPFQPDEFNQISDYLGDIAISLEQAERQAKENDLDFETEVKQLILHGILHLCGYDHERDEGEMNKLELKLRDKLKIS